MREGPLARTTVAVTRPEPDAHGLAEALREQGADVLVLPLVRIEPLVAPELAEPERFDWVVVTSANGVRAVREARREPWPDGVRLAAVGPATARVARELLGVEPAYVPERFTAEALAEGLDLRTGDAVLLPQADLADRSLAERLRERGAEVAAVAAYRTRELSRTAEELERLRAADAVVVASGSAVRSLAAQGGAGRALVVCIGGKTAAVAADVGLPVGLVASEATNEGIIQALMWHFARIG